MATFFCTIPYLRSCISEKVKPWFLHSTLKQFRLEPRRTAFNSWRKTKTENKQKIKGNHRNCPPVYLKKCGHKPPTMAVCWSIGRPAKLCSVMVFWKATLESSCRSSSSSTSSGNRWTHHQLWQHKSTRKRQRQRTLPFFYLNCTYLKPSQTHPNQPHFGWAKTSPWETETIYTIYKNKTWYERNWKLYKTVKLPQTNHY